MASTSGLQKNDDWRSHANDRNVNGKDDPASGILDIVGFAMLRHSKHAAGHVEMSWLKGLLEIQPIDIHFFARQMRV